MTRLLREGWLLVTCAQKERCVETWEKARYGLLLLIVQTILCPMTAGALTLLMARARERRRCGSGMSRKGHGRHRF